MHFIRNLIKKNYFQNLLVAIVLLLGIAIRIHIFPSNNVWIGDIGRDMLAGHLIAFEGMDTQIGHFNSGLNSKYPPFHYYFIAFLSKITNSNYYAIANYLIIWQGIGTLFFFLILRKYFSITISLTATAIYFYSNFSLKLSMHPISAYNSLPIFLAAVLSIVYFVKKNTRIYLIVSSILLALACSVFYGFSLYVPFLILLIFDQKKEFRVKALESLFFIIIFLTSISGMLHTINKTDQGLLESIIDMATIEHMEKIISNFIQLTTTILKNAFPKITTIISFLFLTYLTKGVINRKTRTMFLASLFFVTLNLLLFLLHKNPLGHYLLHLQISMFFFTAYVLDGAMKKSIVVFIILSALLFFSTNGDQANFKYSSNYFSYAHYLQVSTILKNKFGDDRSIISWDNCGKKTNLNNFLNKAVDGWESRSYWYFDKNKPLFQLDNLNNQVETINDKLIIICYIIDEWPNESKLSTSDYFSFNLDKKTYFAYAR